MSKREERLQQLIELVDSFNNLHVKDAAKILNVSEMTIRRDIYYNNSSALNLLGGYIIYAKEHRHISHYFVSEQQQLNIDKKKHIGRLAANLIKNNDIIFFDCGTTIPFIIEHIPKYINFTGVCYSLNVFLALQKHRNCKVILCGGQFQEDNAIFTSINEQTPLDIICPSKSFISAAGISLKGVTCFNLPEIKWKMKAIKKSNIAILIADSSKFNQLKPAYFGELSEFDILISDNIDEQYLAYCDKHSIKPYQYTDS